MPGPEYDLFISYARGDSERVAALVTKLRARGLRAFLDTSDIADFTSITRSVLDGLAESRAFLAFYSSLYPTRRACQWELTVAFLAAQSQGDPRRRVLVVNPEATNEHIEPGELRDARLPDGHDVQSTAAAVANHVERLEGSIKEDRSFPQPAWHGWKGMGSNRFSGRQAELWRLHSRLHKGDIALITGQSTPAFTQIRGLGGVGKSLLAEEYALRFGTAFPGGVFWLNAGSNGGPSGPDRDGREAERRKQIRELASSTGIATDGLAASDVEAAFSHTLGRRNLRYLWIADDLPGSLQEVERRRWIAPNSIGKTIITTRSKEYGAAGEVLDLGVLGRDDAYALLTAVSKPADDEEGRAARDIATGLGGHPLALDVAGSALIAIPGERPFATFLRLMQNPSADAFALANRLGDELPNGHERNIATTLLGSIESLPSEGRDLLQLASVLVSEPIPDDLCVEALRQMWGVDAHAAFERAGAAFRQVAKQSLAERVDKPRAWAVHPLVSRVMRPADAATRVQLRLSAARAILPALSDPSSLPARSLPLYVAHARELATPVETREQAALAVWLARRDYELGNYATTRLLQKQALEFHRRERQPGNPAQLDDAASVATALVATLAALGESKEARALAEEWVEVCTRELGLDHAATLGSMSALASILRGTGELSGAVSIAEQVVERSGGALGPDDPRTLSALRALSLVLSDAANTTKPPNDILQRRALDLASDALTRERRLLGDRHPYTVASLADVAAMQARLGRLPIALKLLQEVLDIRREQLGEGHPATLDVRLNLAAVMKQGQPDEAAQHFGKVLAQYERLFGIRNDRTATAAWNLFACLVASGHVTEAAQVRSEYLDWLIREQSLSSHLQTIRKNLLSMEGHQAPNPH